MKAKKILGLAVAALLISGMAASNAMAVSGTASAEVVVPVTVTPGAAALSFGAFVPNAGGNVTVDNTSGNTVAGGTVQQLDQGSQGNFDITGDILRTVGITLDPSVSMTGPGGTIAATLNHNGTAANALPATIGVGGDLTVPGGLLPGSYVGTFNITADY